MNKFLLIILMIPSIVFAQFEKSQKVILLDNPNAQAWTGSIDQLVDLDEEQHVQLMGQAKTSSLKGSHYSLVQIVWTGLSSTLDPTIQVAFKNPMISVFKTDRAHLKKDQQVPIDGDRIVLLEAIERVHAGKVDKNDLKKRKAVHNPRKNGRHVLTQESEGLGSENGQSSTHSGGKPSGLDNLKTHHSNRKENNKSNPAGAMGQSGSQNTDSSFGDSNGTGQNSGSRTNAQPAGSTGAAFGTGNTASGGSLGSNSGSRTNTEPSGNAGSAFGTGNTASGGSLGANSGSRTNTEPTGSAGSAFGTGNTASGFPGNLPHGMGSNTHSNSASSSSFGMGDAAPNPTPMPDEAAEEPEITHDVTEEGCTPRIDRVHKRVIIRNRCKRFSNGILQDEGECSDSLEIYPIMKDFLCPECTDEVNREEGRAYSRYQEYWHDREGNRNNIGEVLYIDTTRPYPFIDEPGTCAPSIDFESQTACPQVETVYYNFNNTRKIVEECHAPHNRQRIPLIKTTAGCSMVHDFPANISFEQKRSIFTINGVEHEALQCHQVEPSIPHEFVETGCRAFVDLSNGSVTRMVRRKILTSTGSKFITDECEPAQRTLLNATREGCEGDYLHDFASSCSYLKKRYFFNQGTARKYVTPCIRSDEFLRHQAELNGYQNNDVTQTAIPKMALYIDSAEGKLTIDPAKVRGTTGETHYTLEKTETRATGESYFEGCFRRIRTAVIQVYKRPDGTRYEHHAGPGTPICMQADECIRTRERREAVIGRKNGSFWKHGSDIWGTQRRVITTYPDGRKEAGTWH